MDGQVKAELDALSVAAPLLPLRTFPVLEEFVDSFKSSSRRKPILVLLGGTNTGKSLLAGRVLDRICKVLGLPHYLEVTVEDDESLDFSKFDHREHGGILLDGVGDVKTLWRNREVLQGRPKPMRGGRSATMVYSYPYTLARRAVVVTVDLTALNLHLFKVNHWLRDPANARVLHLDGPAWQAPAASPPMPAPAREDVVASWTVDEVASFFCFQDAEGLANTLSRNSVDGRDLCDFPSAEGLVKDLGLTLFAARKVLRLRDAYLNGALSML